MPDVVKLPDKTELIVAAALVVTVGTGTVPDRKLIVPPLTVAVLSNRMPLV